MGVHNLAAVTSTLYSVFTRHRKIHPSWTLKGEKYCRSGVLFGFPELIESYGQPWRDLLAAAGISEAAVHNANLVISWERHGKFVELASAKCQDPNFGLKHALSLPKDFPNCGSLFLLAQMSTDLEDWILTASRYARLYTNAWVPYLSTTQSGEALFRLAEDPSIRPPRHQSEGLLATLLFMVREILGQHDIAPKLVRFKHPKPQSISLHEEIFSCPIEFECMFTELVFDSVYLKFNVGGRFANLRDVMDLYLRRQIRSLGASQGTVADAVASAIPILLGTDICTASGVAMTIGMTEKKMQRQLRYENESFRSIFLRVRQKIAGQLVANAEVPLDVIANLLGYTAPAAFTLAFRSWTGMNPSNYRSLQKSKNYTAEALLVQHLE